MPIPELWPSPVYFGDFFEAGQAGMAGLAGLVVEAVRPGELELHARLPLNVVEISTANQIYLLGALGGFQARGPKREIQNIPETSST